MKRLILALCLLAFAGCDALFPPVPPTPPGPVDPVIVKGLRVLIVRETSETQQLPPSQIAIFTSAPFRKFIADHKATLKIWDDEVDVEFESDHEFVKMLQVPRESLPWIVIAGGSKTISQPLPKTLADTEALIAGAK